MQVLDEIQRSIDENLIETVILGCARTADLTLSTGVPVIDGVAADAQILERPVGVDIVTRKVGAYAKPIKKQEMPLLRLRRY